MLIRDYTDLLDPDYLESILISADWLEEQGRYQESLALKSGQLIPETLFRLRGFGSGYGIGFGFGFGYGNSYGFGYGHGYSYGHGSGIGYGDGYGSSTNPALLSFNYLALSSHVNS